ncbi:hypothetical protein CAPTEDRAFT_189238 [Capitella teleta]|uniref:Uncharacterized protein n=1 Tax=Capitella teleta TaxID=283909 RepID=R7URS0_CAPTE|nr:hypothetical protein CAPTEDRAFT_189238 [Capitella teleta]|eukprot:ELU06602.1 hypothetical protein CAPTEDRAFT_189238 [Capitella teleta]
MESSLALGPVALPGPWVTVTVGVGLQLTRDFWGMGVYGLATRNLAALTAEMITPKKEDANVRQNVATAKGITCDLAACYNDKECPLGKETMKHNASARLSTVKTLKHCCSFASFCYRYRLIYKLLRSKLRKVMPLYTQHPYSMGNPHTCSPGDRCQRASRDGPFTNLSDSPTAELYTTPYSDAAILVRVQGQYLFQRLVVLTPTSFHKNLCPL